MTRKILPIFLSLFLLFIFACNNPNSSEEINGGGDNGGDNGGNNGGGGTTEEETEKFFYYDGFMLGNYFFDDDSSGDISGSESILVSFADSTIKLKSATGEYVSFTPDNIVSLRINNAAGSMMYALKDESNNEVHEITMQQKDPTYVTLTSYFEDKTNTLLVGPSDSYAVDNPTEPTHQTDIFPLSNFMNQLDKGIYDYYRQDPVTELYDYAVTISTNEIKLSSSQPETITRTISNCEVITYTNEVVSYYNDPSNTNQNDDTFPDEEAYEIIFSEDYLDANGFDQTKYHKYYFELIDGSTSSFKLSYSLNTTGTVTKDDAYNDVFVDNTFNWSDNN